MVGIVLVSHSAELAEAVKLLAEQQTRGEVGIAAVGGSGDAENPFGTDAMAILDGVQSVYSDDGVLVLMDLGSALLSTETALEFLDEEQREHVRMSEAPFVEGAITAAVQASIGMDLETVAREAGGALHAKAESLGPAPPVQEDEQASPADEAAAGEQEAVGTVKLVNPAGLHFRPAVPFVQKAAAWSATIRVRNLTNGEGPVDGRSFNQVLGLAAEQGHEIEIRARGEQAREALDALVALVESGFGEIGEAGSAPAAQADASTAAAAPVAGQGRQKLEAVGASPGVAVGIAYYLGGQTAVARNAEASLEKGGNDESSAGDTAAAENSETTGAKAGKADAETEWEWFEEASARAREELEGLSRRLSGELGEEEASIFRAHALLLEDPELVDGVRRGIREEELSAAEAVAKVISDQVERYQSKDAARFRERAGDLRDVGELVLHILNGGASTLLEGGGGELPEGSVIVADELSPSQTAALDRERVVAICTAAGGPTSHAAILARSMGIPAVVGLGGPGREAIEAGVQLAVDGTAGTVIVAPDEETVERYRERGRQQAAVRQTARDAARTSARTRDGRRVEVVANLMAPTEVEAAIDAGAEGVGLLRTEFLFQDRSEPPTEEEQYEIYRQVVEAMAPRPVIIRTLDIGGDKPAPYLRIPAESNPFLGWRAIRISLAKPEFFRTQLRAILRAAASGSVRLMFPMVATLGELLQAKALLREAARELAESGAVHAGTVPLGIMVEVPAAVAMADLFAPEVDFFSIGSNDLTQFTFAADRGNARVADLADPLHPAVLRQIRRVIDAAHAADRWVGLCGELAGESQAIPILLGLGLDEFSMTPDRIPPAKALLAQLRCPDMQSLAHRVLDLSDGHAVRSAVTAAISPS